MAYETVNLSGDQLAAVSREMSRLKRELYGQGPDEAKSYLCDNMLFAVLRGGLTPAERTLVESNEQPLVRQVRLRFQEQRRDSFVEAVERITRSRVASYASQIMFEPTYVIEMFLLEPARSDQAGDRRP